MRFINSKDTINPGQGAVAWNTNVYYFVYGVELKVEIP